jgi:hypothetical protein
LKTTRLVRHVRVSFPSKAALSRRLVRCGEVSVSCTHESVPHAHVETASRSATATNKLPKFLLPSPRPRARPRSPPRVRAPSRTRAPTPAAALPSRTSVPISNELPPLRHVKRGGPGRDAPFCRKRRSPSRRRIEGRVKSTAGAARSARGAKRSLLRRPSTPAKSESGGGIFGAHSAFPTLPDAHAHAHTHTLAPTWTKPSAPPQDGGSTSQTNARAPPNSSRPKFPPPSPRARPPSRTRARPPARSLPTPPAAQRVPTAPKLSAAAPASRPTTP